MIINQLLQKNMKSIFFIFKFSLFVLFSTLIAYLWAFSTEHCFISIILGALISALVLFIANLLIVIQMKRVELETRLGPYIDEQIALRC